MVRLFRKWKNSSPAFCNQLKWETEVSDSEVRSLLERLWTIILSNATNNGIKIKEAKVLTFTDPEEETKIILQIVCDKEALILWNSLETLFETLNDNERNLFLTKIGLRIYY